MKSVWLFSSDIHDRRPFTSNSQLAKLFSDLPPLFREDASQNLENESLIDQETYAVSDAVHEEAFARCLNLGQLSSRHFRIYVAGDYLPKIPPGGDLNRRPLSTVQRIYEVFMKPIHDPETGGLLEVRCEVLTVRDR